MKASKHSILLVGVLGVLLGISAGGRALLDQDDPPSVEQLLEQSRPGPVHERLGRLAGDWEVIRRYAAQGANETIVEGRASTILDGRFLVVDFSLESAQGSESFRYTLGFDRRHDEYSIVVMDTTGTYFVTARGAESDGVIRMMGVDDDPHMARLGWGTKKFAFELALEDDDRFVITTIFVDTRTPEEKLMPSLELEFLRKSG